MRIKQGFKDWCREHIDGLRSFGVPQSTVYAWALGTRKPKKWIMALCRAAIRK